MTFGIVLGSDLRVGYSGILTVETDTGLKEFFRVREIDRARALGSYIVVDCDVKDGKDRREVKLFKSKPVLAGPGVSVQCEPGYTQATRKDGSLIIRVEELPPTDPSLPQGPPVSAALASVDGILRITGDFYAGSHHVIATTTHTQIGGFILVGNVSIGTGGLRLTNNGFAL